MANRALKIDDNLFGLPVPDPTPARDMPDGPVAEDLSGPPAPEGAPAARGTGLGEARAADPALQGAAARAAEPGQGGAQRAGDADRAGDPDLAPAGSLAGEEAMVRAFNQLRDAVRLASRDRDPGAADPQGAAVDAPAEPGRETLEATGAPATREDALFSFGPGGGRVFLSGGAGWTDVVRLHGVGVPPGPGGWSLDLEAGTATEVDGAILLSEDAAGLVRLADGAELIFEGIERIEW